MSPTILFRTKYGSSLYGTATETSDTDWYEVMLPNIDTLILNDRVNITSTSTNNEPGKRNSQQDEDRTTVSVQRFFSDFYAGQSYAIELAFAIDTFHADQQLFECDGSHSNPESSLFAHLVTHMRTHFLNDNIISMLSFAVHQSRLYGDRVGRYNACVAFADVLEHIKTTYPTSSLAEVFAADPTYLSQFQALQAQYSDSIEVGTYVNGAKGEQQCLKLLGSVIPLTVSAKTGLATATAKRSMYGDRIQQASGKSDNDFKSLSHACRISSFLEELLMSGHLTLPVSNERRYVLLTIKKGDVDPDTIRETLEYTIMQLRARLARGNHVVRVRSPELDAEFRAWSICALRQLYNI